MRAPPNASFALRQAPLTYVSAPTPSGRRADARPCAPTICSGRRCRASTPAARPSASTKSKIDDDARATVLFGDGVEGARLPSGDHNVRATYRKGLGLAGNVAAGKITNLLSRPLGVTGASNPAPATGGEDPETIDKARSNAPLTVLTLDRAVSIRDYQDFARGLRRHREGARAVDREPVRRAGVFLTVAGELGRGGAGDERHVPQSAGRAASATAIR